MKRIGSQQPSRRIPTVTGGLTLLILALAILLSLVPAWAQSDVTISNGTSVTALPGDSITFNHTVTYNGADSETFAFDADSDNFTVSVNPTTATLTTGQSRTVMVTVNVPQNATPVADITTVTVATAANPNTTLVSATDTTNVILVGVEVTAPNNSSAETGTVKSYIFRVRNDGSAQETFILSASSDSNFPVALSQTSVSLAPNVTRDVTVSITIPANTTRTSDITTFRATSVTRSTIFDEASVTTTIGGDDGGDDNLYADVYEPNNALETATDMVPGSSTTGRLCSNTLWPVGDIDYFEFVGKAGSAYTIFTDNLSAGIDTYLTVYDRYGNVIGANDDATTLDRASEVTFSVGVDGRYFLSVVNLDPTDPVNLTYCVEINEVLPTATPTPQPTLPPDSLEPNGSFDTAALIEVGQVYNLDFVPPVPPGPDNDFFRLWIKPNILYTCTTSNLSGVNDTNMILYDQNRNGLAGNDDRAPGDFGSEVAYFSTYTGWLYVLVGPYQAPEYDQAELYTYSLQCVSTAPTITPTPTLTPTPQPFNSGGGGSGSFVPTSTPSPTPTPQPTTDAILFATPTTTPRPVVSFQPLATPTPAVVTPPEFSIQVLLYYDENNNFTPELDEGIMDVGAALYDNTTGQLLSFGYTNQAGVVTFEQITVSGAVRVTVPFLNFSQTVTGDTNSITLRIAPQILPGQIP